jgi:hypothetical protein
VCLNDLSQVGGSVHGAFFHSVSQKTEGKRDKATVFLTLASNNKHLFNRALPARDANTIEGAEHRRVTTRAKACLADIDPFRTLLSVWMQAYPGSFSSPRWEAMMV